MNSASWHEALPQGKSKIWIFRWLKHRCSVKTLWLICFLRRQYNPLQGYDENKRLIILVSDWRRKKFAWSSGVGRCNSFGRPGQETKCVLHFCLLFFAKKVDPTWKFAHRKVTSKKQKTKQNKTKAKNKTKQTKNKQTNKKKTKNKSKKGFKNKQWLSIKRTSNSKKMVNVQRTVHSTLVILWYQKRNLTL